MIRIPFQTSTSQTSFKMSLSSPAPVSPASIPKLHTRSRHFTRVCALPAAVVWGKLGDWRGVPGLPTTEEVRVVSGDPSVPGCRRIIGGEGGVSETLTAMCNNGPCFSLSYEFNRAAFGVQHFASTWVVAPDDAAPDSSCRVTIVCVWDALEAEKADAMLPFYNDLFEKILDAACATQAET